LTSPSRRAFRLDGGWNPLIDRRLRDLELVDLVAGAAFYPK